MKVYYAHCQTDYGTTQEDADVNTLGTLGFNVLNPNSPDIQERIQIMKECGQSDEEVLNFLLSQIDKCEGVAFRSLSDGFITDDVYAAITKAQNDRKPVIELPCLGLHRKSS